MKVAVVGSRKFEDQALVRNFVRSLPREFEIVSGGADGPDTWAVDEAIKLQMPYRVFWPQKNKYGATRALFERNNEIAYDSDVMVAFWDRSSTGTLHAISAIRKLKKYAFVVASALDIPSPDLLVLAVPHLSL